MIRIMAWNIQAFGLGKLLPNRWDRQADRKVNILSALVSGRPDVFIVVEVRTGAGNLGDLIRPGAGTGGVLQLLADVRNVLGAQWSVVPPQIITPQGVYSEAVAVFYDSQTLDFFGPLMWDPAGGPNQTGAAVVLNAVNIPPHSYPAPWDTTLPNTAGPPGFMQNQLAGKTAFFNAGAPHYFPTANCRSIWQTSFFDNATQRLLNIFSLHLSPRFNEARDGVTALANLPAISGGVLANEDRVIIGDFNVDALNDAQAGTYQALTALALPIPYTQIIAAPTSLKGVKKSSTTGAANFYNYCQDGRAGNLLSLDNIFVARGPGAPAGAPVGTVVNRVIGDATYPRIMFNTVDAINDIPPNGLGLGPGGPRSQRFRNIQNFGQIGGGRGTSDHMAVAVDLP